MNTLLKDVVSYTLEVNNSSYYMNDYIGSEISILWKGSIICHCGYEKKKLYRSGFCYNCYWTLPEASQSIFKPELCTAHLGVEERDIEWEKKFQIAPHYVYLANSSGVKVGITRKSQGIKRWMDQGATQAILFAEVPNRRYSGDIELALKKIISDKTNWRKMLSGEPEKIDLVELKKKLIKYVPKDLAQYILSNNNVTEIKYPVLKYPKKIKSLKLERTPIIKGYLNGIKGQYLIFDNNQVFNVRAHEGYVVEFKVTT